MSLNGCNCHMPEGGHTSSCASKRRPAFNNGSTLVAVAHQVRDLQEENRRLRQALRDIAKEANDGGVYHPGVIADSARRCAYVVSMAHGALAFDERQGS